MRSADRARATLSLLVSDGPGPRGGRVGRARTHLARVRLARDRKLLLEPVHGRDELIQLLDLAVVAVEQREEAGLRAGRALDAQEAQVTPRHAPTAHGRIVRTPRECKCMRACRTRACAWMQTDAPRALEVLEVHEQVLNPHARALANGRQLRRLVVGEAEGRQGLVRLGEPLEAVDDTRELGQEDVQAVAHDDDVRVVADVAGRGAEVDDGRGERAAHAVGVHVCHDVVPPLLLLHTPDRGQRHNSRGELKVGAMPTTPASP